MSSVANEVMTSAAVSDWGTTIGVVSAQIDDMIGDRDYNNALQSFAAMAGELESFFDEVMVLMEDEAVRKNFDAFLADWVQLQAASAEMAAPDVAHDVTASPA